jgi:general secretion pathway protein F
VLPQFMPLFEESARTADADQAPDRPATSCNDGAWLLVLALLVLAVALRQALKNAGFRGWPVDRICCGCRSGWPLIRETWPRASPARSAPCCERRAADRRARHRRARRSATWPRSRRSSGRATSAKGGAGLSRPLGEAKIFPDRTIHLLRLGEETAQLGAMALKARAEIHEEQTRIAVQRLVSLLVPVITIVMGAAVAASSGRCCWPC